jgi:hypothetical protein
MEPAKPWSSAFVTAMCILCPRFAENDYFFTDTLKIMVLYITLQNQRQK